MNLILTKVRQYSQKEEPKALDTYLPVLYTAGFLITGFNALLGYTRSGYLVKLGLSEAQYGYLLAICGVVLVFTQTMIGRLIDVDHFRRVLLLKVFIVSGILCCIVFVASENLVLLVLFTALERISIRSLMNVNKTLVTILASPKKLNHSLGRLKLGGSLGWIVFSIAFGYILTYLGSKLIFALAGTLLLAQFLLIWFKLPQNIIGYNQSNTQMKWNDGAILSKIHPRIFIYLGVFMLLSISQNGGISYFYLYLKNIGDVSDSFAGWIISASGLVEIPLAIMVGTYCDKHKKEWLFIIMSIFGSMRWILISYISNPNYFFGIQILHAIDVCAVVIVMIGMIADYVPLAYRGTVMGMFASISSIGAILGPLIMGAMTDAYDMTVAMTTMGGIGLVAVTIFALYVIISSLKGSISS